jgi:hypothetical protein
VIVNPELYEKYRVVINREKFLQVEGVLQIERNFQLARAFVSVIKGREKLSVGDLQIILSLHQQLAFPDASHRPDTGAVRKLCAARRRLHAAKQPFQCQCRCGP